MRIIPAIDIIGGKCVRLTQGDYGSQKTYADDPVAVATMFDQAGFQYLHLVDLDGAKAGRVTNWDTLEAILRETKLSVDFGGGVRSEAEVEKVLSLGAKQVTLGSLASKQPALAQKWIEQFGHEAIILGADSQQGKVAVNGWQDQTGIDTIDFVREFVAKGARYVICTDISKDGMLAGPSMGLYCNILRQAPDTQLIASGGVTSLRDLQQLKQAGLEGAIIGKAIYEGLLSLPELVAWQTQHP